MVMAVAYRSIYLDKLEEKQDKKAKGKKCK